MAKHKIMSGSGPMGYCDEYPSTPHRIVIVHTYGLFNQEKSCKNWRLNNRSM
jgi:hypothetical protein